MLLLGHSQDEVVNYLNKYLVEHAIDFDFLPLDKVLNSATFEFSHDDFTISLNQKEYKLNNYESMYFRVNHIEDLSNEETKNLELLVGAVSVFPGVIANRPYSGFTNSSKIVQLFEFKAHGIDFPEALLTNQSEHVIQFTENSNCIYKSPSSARSIVNLFNKEDIGRLTYLKNCPVLFQRFIKGDDVRVHVVQRQCFAERIKTCGGQDENMVDYRYESAPNLTAEKHDLPQKIYDFCIDITEFYNLTFSGIDFKLDELGHYWPLEVNPSPCYIGYDMRISKRITEALVEVLTTSEK